LFWLAQDTAPGAVYLKQSRTNVLTTQLDPDKEDSIMTSNRKAVGIVALAITFFGAPAVAELPNSLEFADELDSCVTALNGELDLDGVSRVRHVVTKSSPKRRGYMFTIRTQTFSSNANKVYAVTCVADGKSLPLKLQVSEIDT
jgi:hypothetical protein